MLLDETLLRNAIASLALVIAAAPIGRFLVLRRMSLVGDAIGHSLLPGAVLGAMVSNSQSWAIAIGAAVSGALLFAIASRLPKILKLGEDTVFAIFYLSALSIGVLLAAKSNGEIHIEEMLFGNANNTNWFICGFAVCISIISLVAIKLIYRPLLLETIEPNNPIYEKSTLMARSIFYVLLTLLIVAAFQIFGALLAIGIIVLPAIASGFWSNKLISQIFIAAIIGIVTMLFGNLIFKFSGLNQSAVSILILSVFTLVSAFALGKR